jgi:hypothetical protein
MCDSGGKRGGGGSTRRGDEWRPWIHGDASGYGRGRLEKRTLDEVQPRVKETGNEKDHD